MLEECASQKVQREDLCTSKGGQCELRSVPASATLTVEEDSIFDFVGTRERYSLMIDVAGDGKVTDKGTALARVTEYEHGTVVELEAVAAGDGRMFSRWEGDIAGAENPVKVEMLRDTKVTAAITDSAAITGTVDVQHCFPRSVVDRSVYGLSYGTHRTFASQAHTSLDSVEPTEFIIGFEAGVSEEERMATLDKLDYEVIGRLSIINAYLVKPTDELEDDMVQALSLPGIRYL